MCPHFQKRNPMPRLKVEILNATDRFDAKDFCMFALGMKQHAHQRTNKPYMIHTCIKSKRIEEHRTTQPNPTQQYNANFILSTIIPLFALSFHASTQKRN